MRPAGDPRQGILFILSAPSGGGKTTLGRELRRQVPELAYSVSYTSRAPRCGERDGIDYHFIAAEEFERRIRRGEWAEWARVHGNYYGTSAAVIERTLADGRHLLLDIDVQGADQIVARYPDSITIFIMPPSLEVLRRRLVQRATEKPADLDRRLAAAEQEMACRGRYRHVVVNDDLAMAAAELVALVRGYIESMTNDEHSVNIRHRTPGVQH